MVNRESLVVGPFEVNCYLLWDEETGDGLIIDPGDEHERIMAAVDKAGFAPQAILLTHGHADHVAAVSAIKGLTKVPLYVGSGDEELLRRPAAIVSAMLGRPIEVPPPDVSVSDEQPLSFGSLSFRVLATPGHSPGSTCYLDERHGALYCGDTLFAGGIGRTDLPGGSLDQLLESIRSKILTLPDSFVCYPGHGPETTVGTERVSNPFLVGGFYA